MKKIFYIVFLLIIFQNDNVYSAQKDVTYNACLDVIKNGFDKANIENQFYLIGKENGIEAGVTLAYKKHNIKDSLPSSTSYPYIIDIACKAVINDKSNQRAMTVFNKKVFNLYILTK